MDQGALLKVYDHPTSRGEKSPLPSNIRLFLEHLLGRDGPITEKDFSEADLTALKEAVKRSMQKTSKKDGVIGYGDYNKSDRYKPSSLSNNPGPGTVLTDSFSDPAFRLETTLGMAKFSTDKDGNIIVEDKYNFNAKRPDVQKKLQEDGAVSLMVEGLQNNGIMGLLNVIGNVAGATDDEPGTEVKINLGKLDKE